MKHPFTKTEYSLTVPDQQIKYRIYRNSNLASKRRLVLLHGAGVAGRDTWEMLLGFLSHWGEILVPDQRGTGDTHSVDGEEYPFTPQMLVNDLSAIVDYLGWWQFDLAGYSMGGLVSLLYKQANHDRVGKQFLLESAVLDRPCWETTVLLRQRFSEAAVHLRDQQAETGIRNFLDTISPNRKVHPQSEAMTISRLAARPLGFANALDCVTAAIREIDREALVAAQGDVSSFIGGLSVELMHEFHRGLAERLPNWHYFLVAGTDHALPFQKPRQIARTMNAEMERYLQS